MRFSPVVAIEAADPAPPPHKRRKPPLARTALIRGAAQAGLRPTAIFVDLTGCRQVFRGLHNVLREARSLLDRLGIAARLAIAPAPGAAWALAFGRTSDTLTETLDPHLLSDLPPAALRLEPEVVDALHHLGIQTVGALMRIPRTSLPSRFGEQILLRIDQALGGIPEPLTAVKLQSPIYERMDFDGVAATLESTWSTFELLIQRISEDLLGRGCGARQLDIELFRPCDPSIQRTLHLTRPSRDPRGLFKLLRSALESQPPAPPPRRYEESTISDGFSAIALAVPIFQQMLPEQVELLDHERHIGQVEMDRLIERLRVRLGSGCVARARLIDSHVPEKRWRAETEDCPGDYPGDSSGDWAGDCPDAGATAARPLCLLAAPIEVGVMVAPSHDRDGRPVLVRRGSVARRVVHAVGPERIAGPWWEGNDKTRDYFDIETDSADRWWMFRVNETGKWYLQGEFL